MSHELMIPLSIAIPILLSPIVDSLARSGRIGRALDVASISYIASGLSLTMAFLAGARNFERAWFELLGGRIEIHLGLDGLSYAMSMMSVLIFLASTIYSKSYMAGRAGLGEYSVLLMMLFSALLGVFLARDLILFFFFWELMVIPTYFLIDRFGYEGCRKAAMRFFAYSQFEALLIMLAIGIVLSDLGSEFLEFENWSYPVSSPKLGLIFSLLTLAFLIKIATFPLYSWLPPSYDLSPTPVSSILGGVVTEVGAYAIHRISFETILSSSPDQLLTTIAPAIMIALGFFTAIFASILAMRDFGVKRVIAYSSMSHMGYFLVGNSAGWLLYLTGVAGKFNLAILGSLLHLIAHGFSKSLSFLVSGFLVRELGAWDIRRISGILARIPLLGFFGITAMMSLAGAPPLACFPSEIYMIFGIAMMNRAFLVFLFGLLALMSTGYSLRYVYYVFWRKGELADGGRISISGDYVLAMVILSSMVLLIGAFPGYFLDILRSI